jgi:hypothetical protein
MDTILVWKCPHCFKPHLYALAVRRSHWMGACYHPARPLEFTRLFTCPVTDQDFQVSMHLMQPHGEDYERIAVQSVLDVAVNLAAIPTETDFYREHLAEEPKEHKLDRSDLAKVNWCYCDFSPIDNGAILIADSGGGLSRFSTHGFPN